LYGTRWALLRGDHRADPIDQVRALEHFDRERPRAAVLWRDEKQARASVTDDDPRQETEIVLDDAREDGLRGYVDDPRARRLQKKEESLFIGLHLGAFHVEFGGDRR
jgi:hypothetical protein